jgi:hypothetical protein
MPLPKLNSREAEAPIQKAIQDVGSGVEPSIRKASDVRALPLPTVALGVFTSLPDVHPITSCLHNAYISLDDERLGRRLDIC